VIYLRLLGFAGWPLFFLMIALYLNQRDRTTEAIEGCRTEAVQAVLERERIAHNAERERNLVIIQEMQTAVGLASEARASAEASAAQARTGTLEREQIIRRLRAQANETDCLNAFVDERSLDRVRVQTGDCAGIRTGAGTDRDPLCADPGGTAGENRPNDNRADVTYSDVLILWGRDRDSIETLNGQLKAIERLQEERQ
jgi:hypothetical protein